MSSKTKRFGAAIVAAALSASMIGISHAAFADDFVDNVNINTDTTGQITIYKRVEAGSNGEGNIFTPGSGSGELLPGSKFTAYKLNLDLKNKEGWVKLSQMSTDLIPSCAAAANGNTGFLIGGQAKITGENYEIDASTNGIGSTTTPLPVAAYLVCETQIPANSLKAAAPFVVTIPSPATKTVPAGGSKAGWVYNVTVYPKNVKIEDTALTKTVATDITKLSHEGGSHTFTLSTKIPSIPDTDAFKFFQIADNLAATFDNVAFVSAEINDPVGAQLAVSDFTSTVNKNYLLVSMLAGGTSKLKANSGKILTVTFKATAKDTGWTGSHENKGVVVYDVTPQGSDPVTPVNPLTDNNVPEPGQSVPPTTDGKRFESNVVSANWGQVKLTKKVANTNQALPGAEFTLYAADLADNAICTQDNAATIVGKSSTTVVKTGLVSGTNGEILIRGLKIDAKNEQASNLQTERCYIFEETKAPLGYVLPTDNTKYTAVKIKAQTPSTDLGTDLTVFNTPTNVPSLPLTGASGQLLMLAGGASLVLFAVGSLLVARRRTERP